ncbi:unknown [Firmicutes bacterium CAG:460]|nr:unknown [Firmicutes bacterium CAG:460]
MEKLNFKNKGETGAIPINADNLNLMQTNVENEFNNITNYSTTETKIGKWMNKDLYRKVVVIVGLSVNTVQSTNYGIDSVDQIWIENAFVISEAGRVVTMPMVGYDGSLTDKCDIWLEKSEGVIKMYSNGGWGADWWFYVILNYTKN